MTTPPFFSDIPTVALYDPLAKLLGASKGGILEYSYTDCVKLAGHSCPTVAGAYLILFQTLRTLGTESLPTRGSLRVTVRGKLGEGVVGVNASIATLITGATAEGGFHGLGGKFDRRGLLRFDPTLKGDMMIEDLVNHRKIIATYTPAIVPADPKIAQWMGKIVSGEAEESTRLDFQHEWQERVRKILIDFRDDPRLIQVEEIAS